MSRITEGGVVVALSVLLSAAGAAWIARSTVTLPPCIVLVSHSAVEPAEYGEDWVRCGDVPGTPVLDGLFLVGATQEDVGEQVGSVGHVHNVQGRTGNEVDGTQSPEEGADNFTGDPNWQHKHDFEGVSATAEHLPPARKVLFLCKRP